MSEETKVHFGEIFDGDDWSKKPTQDMRGHKFYYCSFHHLELPEEGKVESLYGACFHGCNFQNLKANGTWFDHMTFDNCDFKGAEFKSSVWTNTRAYKCDFTWANLANADLKGLNGEGSDFKLSNIHKAKELNVWDRDMISEVIRVAADGDSEALMIASLVKCSVEFCWREWRSISLMPQWKRAGEVIYKYLNEHPSIVKAIKADLKGE